MERIKWTKEKCQELALIYKTRNEFKKLSRNAYNASIHNGWLENICLHMKLVHKENNYWTKEKCTEEFLKYNSINQFRKKSQYTYNLSRKNGWLDEICFTYEIY